MCHFASYLLHLAMFAFHFAWYLPRFGTSTSHLHGVFATFWYFKRSCGFLESFLRFSFRASFRVSFRVSLGFHVGFRLGFHVGFL
jgi:hypothetical protein